MLNNSLTKEQAMSLNRKERRRLGKINGIKIPGSTQPFINWLKKAGKK